MLISRIATLRDPKQPALIVEVVENPRQGDGHKFEISRAEAEDKTAEQLELALSTKADLIGVSLPNVHIHVNRDGSLAIATGKEPPKIWPEDAKVEW